MRHLCALVMLILLPTAVPLGAQADAADAAAAADAEAADPQVVLETSKGTLVLELYPDQAPKTVESFLGYVESGFFDGTIFHRVIPDFMIQGGGYTPDMKLKPTRGAVQNEADNGLLNVRGAVAMARTNDPHSATAQFFVNTVDNAYLNHRGKTAAGWGYTVFGKVVEGMDTVDAISAVKTRGNTPIEPVMITKASVKGQ